MNVKIFLYNFLYLGFLVSLSGMALKHFFKTVSKEYLLSITISGYKCVCLV